MNLSVGRHWSRRVQLAVGRGWPVSSIERMLEIYQNERRGTERLANIVWKGMMERFLGSPKDSGLTQQLSISRVCSCLQSNRGITYS